MNKNSDGVGISNRPIVLQPLSVQFVFHYRRAGINDRAHNHQCLWAFQRPTSKTTHKTLAISPDASRIAIESYDQLKGQVRILDLHNGTESNLSLPNGWLRVWSLGWAPDNKALLVSGCADECSLARVGLDGKSSVLLHGGRNQNFYDPVSSPDGHNLAFGQQVWNANVWLLENF